MPKHPLHDVAIVAVHSTRQARTLQETEQELMLPIRTNGSKNAHAVYYGKAVSAADVLNSRMIADPFRLLDCAMTAEGGCALLMTTRERARDMDVQPIFVLDGNIRIGCTNNGSGALVVDVMLIGAEDVL